ncbi:MAG: hypothetical protein U1E05_03460 [Patescibacteria group bacterium]|nr:hypothetical protein [Patescibacteria group bacterium]
MTGQLQAGFIRDIPQRTAAAKGGRALGGVRSCQLQPGSSLTTAPAGQAGMVAARIPAVAPLEYGKKGRKGGCL